MIKSAIMQPTFMPWIGYFDLIDQSDIFVYLDHVQFDYRSWQHKNKIKDSSKNELILTIPVKSGEKKQKLKDVLIHKESKFFKKYLNSIFFNYKKSKYFESIFPDIKKIFEKNHTYLIDLNYDLINFFCKYLKINSKFLKSSSLNTLEKKDKLILEILEIIESKNYYTPAGSVKYLNKNKEFAEKNVNVFLQEYQCQKYNQLHGDFIDYLSVLDLIMNEGPNSKNIILSGKKYKKYDF
tara:strand:+ start:2547 stop:3260 length:714 start_codon:yes stop_codon:yes gene_type:complete